MMLSAATPVDLLQAIENGPQKGLIFRDVGHVVDRQHDHGLDPFLAHPLRA